MTYPNVWVSLDRQNLILDVSPDYTIQITRRTGVALRRAARTLLADAVTDEEITAQQRVRALAAIQERFKGAAG